ncbi:MAG: hypothetical protein HXS48_27035 [Theionarchaea archaeon]|nr:hypothetical protein [Theionarchaea archaeon]
MNPRAIPLIVVLVFLVLPYPSLPVGIPPKGILIRPQTTIQTEEDIDTIINMCEAYRITHIFLLVKQDTGPESGLVYYNSSTVPRISDFDVLSLMLEKAHRKNINVYAWFPLLYDKWAAESGLRIEGNWISPLQSVSYYSSFVNEVDAHNVDGILFDYVRFSDDFAASEQLKKNFGQKFGYNMNSVELSLEKERDTQLWSQWISFRNEVLSQFLKDIMPESTPVGVTVTSDDLDIPSEVMPFTLVDFVAAQVEENPPLLINKLTLSTEAAIYVVLPNDYVSQVRQLLPESDYADLLIFDSDTWDESAFKRIKKAEIPFTDVRITTLPFIDFYNEKYDMKKWRIYEVNTAVFPAGHVFWTYFKYLPYKEKWSLYTEKYDRDYVEEMISEAKEAELYSVLSLDIQSEEYVTKYKDAASITYQWGVMRDRICLSELNGEHYKREFFDMAFYLADNYEAEAILISNISYLEDCFCTDCLESYINFMAEKGVTLEDWPRRNGEIDIYHQTIREWKTAQITQFLRELREHLRDSNKELWVEVPVSTNLEYMSSEYGLHLSELEQIADRIVLINIDIKNPPRVGNVAKSLPGSGYVLSFLIEPQNTPARAYVLDSLKSAYENGIDSAGVYPHSAVTESLWSAFYIAYAYRLALTDEALMEIYTMESYGGVIDTYFVLEEERKEEEMQTRENARQNIHEAEKSYSQVLDALEEARQVDLNVVTFEVEIQQYLMLLSEAKQLFTEGSYQSAEEKGRTTIIEFSTLEVKIGRMVRQERIKRVTSGVSILVIFLLIMMYVRFSMRKRRK